MAKDYSKTLNLPATDFEMRANLPQREEITFKKWLDEGLFGKLMQKNKNLPMFVFHDGPPYANGDIHIGHSMNKILKDFIVKYKNMSGFITNYIHGWDTHGLPTEMVVMKKEKINRRDVGDLAYRQKCAAVASGYVGQQMKQFQRLGIFGDWERSYKTYQPRFEEEQIKIFGKMLEKGCIYKGLKPVYWCASDETALAEAEIEYSDDECDSIYVKFNVKDDKNLFTKYTKTLENVYFVIWTTTTWTLPGNVAICLGPDFEYLLIESSGEFYVMAKELAPAALKKAGIEDYKKIASFKGSELERIVTKHPFYDRDSLVINGDHVSLDSGTGCVHTAPGHGVDDFNVCKKYPELPIYVPVDFRGYMTSEAGKYEGQKTGQANISILTDLKENGMLFATERISHQYPHCWRCKSPILFRATEQWFCSVDDFKALALENVKKVDWYPTWGEIKIENMIKDRADWCISRQRIWGVPIPIFYCKNCGDYEISKKYIEKVAALFGKEGSDAWYKYTPEQITGEMMKCPACGETEFIKETDIMDVWFDSGTSYAYVLKDNEYSRYPADLYLEGNDQYRGWFQSSLLTSVAVNGIAPYKKVITHGMVVDGDGKKMSKSLGNGIDPMEVAKEYGSDVLRLWVSSVDYTADARISKDIMKQLSEIYRKIRNTSRILLANLGKKGEDFNPAADMVSYDKLYEIDRWALASLNELVKRVIEAYENYQYHYIYHDIHNFCTTEMSKLYIDITKDRLYVESKNSLARRSAQTVMYIILHSLTRLIAPILNFTADEIWQCISHSGEDDLTNVNFNLMPKYNPAYSDPSLSEKWDKLFFIREDIMKSLELARAKKLIGKSLDAKICIYGDSENEYMKHLYLMESELSTVFIVSKTLLINGDIPEGAEKGEVTGLGIAVSAADGKKCDRCWIYSEDYTEADGSIICKRCGKILNG